MRHTLNDNLIPDDYSPQLIHLFQITDPDVQDKLRSLPTCDYLPNILRFPAEIARWYTLVTEGPWVRFTPQPKTLVGLWAWDGWILVSGGANPWDASLHGYWPHEMRILASPVYWRSNQGPWVYWGHHASPDGDQSYQVDMSRVWDVAELPPGLSALEQAMWYHEYTPQWDPTAQVFRWRDYAPIQPPPDVRHIHVAPIHGIKIPGIRSRELMTITRVRSIHGIKIPGIRSPFPGLNRH